MARRLATLVVAGATLLQGLAAPAPRPAWPDSWQQAAELLGPSEVPGDHFGLFAAVSGGTAVVGAYGQANSAGRAYVFTGKTPEGWHQTAELAGSDTVSHDFFGDSVAISGSTIVVGAPSADFSGRAYVFTGTGGKWHQSAELAPSSISLFGLSVATSGNTIVVGAPFAANGGRVYVFTRTSGAWHNVAELAGSDTVRRDEFGWSIAVSGSTIVVGSPNAKSSGRAYVFTHAVSGWHQTAELVGSGSAAGDLFGGAVAVSGTTLVIGAAGNSKSSGQAYVFKPVGIGWRQVAELMRSGTVTDDGFGAHVAVSGNIVAVTAPDHAHGAGAVYVFSLVGARWHEVAVLQGSGAVPSHDLGSSVSVSGVLAVIGSVGRVYVFRGKSF